MKAFYQILVLCSSTMPLLEGHAGDQNNHYKSRMGRVERLVRTYVESALYDDLILFKEALAEYAHWYGNGPCDMPRFCTRLSDEARELIRNIMYYAKRYVTRGRGGQLTPEGDAYYQEIIDIVNEYLESTQPCGAECRVPLVV
jgi:hypothetical protein